METSSVEWTRELTIELLQLLKDEPVIWNPNHPNYDDENENFDAWRRIQGSLSVHLSLSDLEKKKSEAFYKFEMINAKIRNSMRLGDPENVYRPTWFAYDTLSSFLLNSCRRRMSYIPQSAPQVEREMADQQKAPTFQEQFKLFAKFGDRDSDGKHIKLTQSDKWMKQAKVIDGKKITATDTGICFKKLKQPKLNESDYNVFLEDLAKSKGFDVSELKTKMVNCGPPGFTSSASPSTKPIGAVERLTDPSKYTGSHKERFDESGKGKGLSGRRDEVDASGYVTGYTNKDTYPKN